MKIAVWYHCCLSGPRIASEDHAIAVMAHQMYALKESGLSQSSQEIHIGINGDMGDALLVGCFAPDASVIQTHGKHSHTEIPTLQGLRDWLSPGWLVLYHQAKGASHAGQSPYEEWRGCMERACVWGWRRCVKELSQGAEVVGCHWLTPERFPGSVTSPFFGGTFWWARSEYLLSLPALPPDTFENRYEAESWIGRRRPYPAVVDFHPQWPGPGCART